MANERLRALEEVEKEIAMVLQCAGKDIYAVCPTNRWSATTSEVHLLPPNALGNNKKNNCFNMFSQVI